MANNEELKNNLFSFRDTFKDYTDCYTVRSKEEMVEILRNIYL